MAGSALQRCGARGAYSRGPWCSWGNGQRESLVAPPTDGRTVDKYIVDS